MIQDKARLLIVKAQMVKQGRETVRMIRDTAAALDEVVNHRRIPAARSIARSLRAGFDHAGQLARWALVNLLGRPGGA